MYTWSDILALFNINAATLWRWCRRAHVVPHKDPVDNRRRYLDNDQLLKLARLHQRVLTVNTESAKLDYIAQLERRIEDLEQKLGNKKELDQ